MNDISNFSIPNEPNSTYTYTYLHTYMQSKYEFDNFRTFMTLLIEFKSLFTMENRCHKNCLANA